MAQGSTGTTICAPRSARLQQAVDEIGDHYSFSARKREVLAFMLLGRPNVEAAEILQIRVGTVRFHAREILDTTGCTGRAELLRLLWTFEGEESELEEDRGENRREATDSESTLPARSIRYQWAVDRLCDLYQVSPRETDVLKLLLLGRSNPEIGLCLGRSTRTVRVYVSNILRKAGISSRAQIAAALFGEDAGTKERSHHTSMPASPKAVPRIGDDANDAQKQAQAEGDDETDDETESPTRSAAASESIG